MLSNISDLFTMASLVICMLLSGIIFYYLRTRINMLEQSVMDQAQLLQQVVTSIKSSQIRQMGLQQQQHQQQQNNEDVERCSASLDNNDYSLNNNSTINLIQVSDDSESSDVDSDDDDDSYDDDDNDDDNDNDNGVRSGSKIIDLSTITSSSSMSFLPLTKSDDVKIIELKSNIKLNSESDQSDESDESDESDQSDDNDEGDQSNDDNDNDDDDNDDNETKQNNAVHETNKNCGNNKIFKSIVIEEDVTLEEESNILSLDKMKNMPVNTLRNLAKKKLNNVDTPTINKMSKKEILKAFNS